ncbi:MAG TPA: hypothetical protein VNL18_09905, partial [Gemmatimonadales bacterium]|nr:hypothetical protein [Gemmatimonadales bacterium]
MRSSLLVLTLLALAAPAAAQDRTIVVGRSRSTDELVRQLPRDVADEVIQFFNRSGTFHFSGATRIPGSRGIDGDVAVLGGPVTLAGRISGSLVVINGDLVFEPGAVVGGDVLVVGGTVEGAARAEIAGELRAYRDVLRYRRYGDELVYAPQRELPAWARRWRRSDYSRSHSGFYTALGGTYNRVEGVPILFGPRADLFINDGLRWQGELLGVIRSGRNFELDNGDFGYRIRGEFVIGSRQSNVGVGLRLIDLYASIEPWPLKDFETGWAAFLLHRDYRDLYRRRGASAFASLRPTREASLTFEAREERHFSGEARDPWTLFRSDEPWRPNPAITEGLLRSATASLRVDSRNDRRAPSSGFYLLADYEAGRLSDVTGEVDPRLPGTHPDLADGRLDFERFFVDARLYTRISPSGRVNLRVAGGGWAGGEALPLQRRVSIGGPDPLSGFRFREFACGGAQFNGAPALCDRVALAQAEFRTHLGFDIGPEWANDWGDQEEGERYEPFHVSGPDVVVFADAGYAWNVNGANAITA